MSQEYSFFFLLLNRNKFCGCVHKSSVKLSIVWGETRQYVVKNNIDC